MLEIVAIFFCCKSIGAQLRRKGRKPLVFQILFVISWFAAEFIAGVGYGIVQAVMHGGAPPEFDMAIYFVALLGAAASAGFWFLVVYLIPPVQKPHATPMFGTTPESFVPPSFAPPTDPHNPYAPPRSRT